MAVNSDARSKRSRARGSSERARDEGKRGEREVLNVVLVKCLNRYRVDPLSVNTITVLSKAFIECFYELCREVMTKGGEQQTHMRNVADTLRDYATRFVFHAVESMYNAYLCKNIEQYLNQVSQAMNEIAISLSNKYHVFLLKFTTTTRLTIDTQNIWLPFDISISWDPIRNLPYIPSSSLKGVARSYFELNNVSIGGLNYKTIFGSEEQEGIVVISDAYPIGCSGRSLIEPDIINPHYEEHRNRIDEASARPRPIIFPTVAPRTTFAFIVAVKGHTIDEGGRSIKLNPQEVKAIVKKIAEGLEQGLGAKVSVGYGRIKIAFEDVGQII